MSHDTFDVLSRSRFSFGDWFVSRVAPAVLSVALMTGILGMGSLLTH